MTDPCINHEFASDDSTTCIHCGGEFPLVQRKPGYLDRCAAQLEDWVKGNSKHNTVDDECCPDFSCCSGQQTPKEHREAFAAAMGKAREDMLMTFLSRSIELMGKGGKVHIAGRTAEELEERE